jgi:hypothetical protein
MSEDKQNSAENLSRSQVRANEALEDALDGLRSWHGTDGKKLEKDPERFELYVADYEDCEKAMASAIRAGLHEHPTVDKKLRQAMEEWIRTRRVVGNWEVLRRAKSGVQRGVKRPMTKVNLWLANESRRLFKQGNQPEAIRRALINILGDANYSDLPGEDARKLRERLKGMSRQGFHKLLASLDR